MDLNKYQELSAVTAVYPDDPEYLTMAIMGEAGEVANVRKKSLRIGATEYRANLEEWRTKFVDETGDILWYLAAICRENGGFTLQQVYDRSLEAFSKIINGRTLRSNIRNLVLATVELDYVSERDGLQSQFIFHYMYPVMEKLLLIWDDFNISLNEVMEYNLAKLASRAEAGTIKTHE